MAASEKTLIYQESIDPLKKQLSDKDLRMLSTQDESNYVDLDNLLDLKIDDTETIKVTFTDEENRLAIIECNSQTGDQIHNVHKKINNPPRVLTTSGNSINYDGAGHVRSDERIEDHILGSFETATSSDKSQIIENFVDCPESPDNNQVVEENPTSDISPEDEEKQVTDESTEDLEYTDEYFDKKSDSEDEFSVVLADHLFHTIEDESHFITTHEIQLSELDHDVDSDFGTGSSWDIKDDHQVYSFVDYASFDSDETIGGKDNSNVIRDQDKPTMSEAAVSTKPESDLCDMSKCAGSDESLSKTQNGSGSTAGQIQLSIKSTSRAINEPSNVQEKENIIYHTKHAGDMSRYVFRGVDAKGDKVGDSAKCFIAVPRRIHFGRKLKGKHANDHSSSASSAVSELDDADKEVRNLTARAFKSLAYPYFDAINFSTSSESSVSEHGLGINRWSTFVDLKYSNMNMSNSRDKNLVAHKSSTSNLKLARNRDSQGVTGLTFTTMRAPPVEIFAINGNLANHKKASLSGQKIEVMGKFGQGQRSGVHFTETLNFHRNVKAGLPSNERRVKSAQNTAGSRSTDEVTHTLPSEGSEASKQPSNVGETMEDTHKKAIFASSLLKNVISKKMQFEQERKMERGEISEPDSAPSPCFPIAELETQEETTAKESSCLKQQGSKHSETDSDFTIVCLDELGDILDSNSCDAKDDSHRQDSLTLALETNLESTNEEGIDTKKGAFERSKSTLLRSQNSAFRSWRDGELEFQKELKNDKTSEGNLPPVNADLVETDLHVDPEDSELMKMSRFFVPSIQLLSNEKEQLKPQPNTNYSAHLSADQVEVVGMKLRSDNTLYVSDTTSRAGTSKSPEIKISVRSLKDKSDPFNIAKLLTPNVGYNAANLIKAADDSKCLRGESSDKVPHFMVRDIRDHKGGSKFQTPIHQVRDVRKLVKSSYHFVSLDNENKSNTYAADLYGDHKVSKQSSYRNPASLSPIVIKCQSVNTNSIVKQPGDCIEVSRHMQAEDILEADRSTPQAPTEGAKTGASFIRTIAEVPPAITKQPKDDLPESPVDLQNETAIAPRRQEKFSDTGEKKPDSKMGNQAALEKLQAAVKTMEQLYVFDRNEWKRKTGQRQITDSQVLSQITSEVHEVPGEEQGDTAGPVTITNTDKLVRRDSSSKTDKIPLPVIQSTTLKMASKTQEKQTLKSSNMPVNFEDRNELKAHVLGGGGLLGNKTIPNQSQQQRQKSSVLTTANSSMKTSHTHASPSAPFSAKNIVPKSPKLPVSLKITHPKRVMEERERPNGREAERFGPAQSNPSAEPENYLTIPVKPNISGSKQASTPSREKAAVYTLHSVATGGHPATPRHSEGQRYGDSHQSPKRSTFVMETRSQDTPTATIYHHPVPMTMAAAQPQVICFSPTVQSTPTPVEAFQPTQRRMLLDPTTGNYYLVDTPVQQATRRLFDPETGQYVDVPMPQQPMTPVPMPISPLALNPGAYAHTYMFYPGYMPTPTVIPARTLQTQLSMQSEADEGDKTGSRMGQQGDGAYMESPYYLASGTCPPTAQGVQHITTSRAASGKQPVISIRSQQGPRIIAPPSFDGTTMSFVVEHR